MNPVFLSPQTAARRFFATPRRIACAVTLACLPLAAQALDIAQTPLFAGGSAAANIVYMHDDSGSMTTAITSNNDPGMFNANVRYELPLDYAGNPLPNAPHPDLWGTASTAADGYSCYNATTPCPRKHDLENGTYGYKYRPLDAAGKQNFANWYAYYRTKDLAAKAAISRAFKDLPGNVRLGWGRINNNSTNRIDGVTVNRLERGVRPYSSVKQSFYQWLFGIRPSGNTPLRAALDQVGKYFDRSAGGHLGPWADDPEKGEGNSGLACRKSFVILMTDGEWNDWVDWTADIGNADGLSSFSTPPKPDGTRETWSTTPFKDSSSKTLGDIAWKYWARDMAPGDDNNRVVGTQRDPAWWQHMTTFTIGFGALVNTNSMDKATVFANVENDRPNAWPSINGNPSVSVSNNDLLHAAVNGHGDYFTASNAQEFVDSLEAILSQVAISVNAIAPVAASSSTLRSDTRLFQATFDGKGWSGDLQAFKLNSDGTIVSTPQWSATIPAHGNRSLFTWRPDTGQGARFLWSELSPAQQNALGNKPEMLDYLRGNPANVTPNGLKYRSRAPLGDILNSAPLYVDKAANFGYGTSTSLDGADRSAYQNRRMNATRANMVYVGANDGMLHAFDADTGVERFAYVPNGVFANLPALANPNYTHRYYVDGSPTAGDALFNPGDWRTVLVGSTGAGGTSYFALDVESPASFTVSRVLWEITGGVTPNFENLGVAIGQATLARMNNGEWAVLFANGYNSGGAGNAERAQLFIVSAKTGALLQRIDTGAGPANGLATPLVIDLDQDGTADYAYAGDLLGNLWKFDLTSEYTTGWKVALSGKPLLIARDGSNRAQPITAKPQAARHPNGGVMIYVGTGKFLESADRDDKSLQTIYGVYDDDAFAETRRTSLVEQTLSEDASGEYRFVSENLVHYTGALAKRGFYLDLQSTGKAANGERVLAVPQVMRDRVIFNTLITTGGGGNSCAGGGVSGWLLEVDPFSGARTADSVFDLNDDNAFNSGDHKDGKVVSGVRVDGGGGVTIVKAGDKDIKHISAAKGADGIQQIAERPVPAGRQSWMQIR